MNDQALNIGVFGARGIPSTYSGFDTFLTTLLPELAARGHDVTMYCRKGQVTQSSTYRGVTLRHLPAYDSKQLSTLSHGLLSAVTSRWRRHDVVLVVSVANAPFCRISHLTGQPVVLNTDGQEWLRGKWGGAARRYFYESARMAKTSAVGLVTDCQAMRDIYLKEFQAESSVIPYTYAGVDVQPRSDVLNRYGLQPNRFVAIAGRLNPENNIAEVAESFCRSSVDIPLAVMGVANYDSPVQSRLEELAGRDPRLRLLGHVEDRGVFASLIGLAAVYVHAHSVGGINPSLVEAMGSSARVLALDTPFNREALADAGRYFEDPSSDFGPALEATLLAEPAGERERARLRAHTVFTLKKIADAYEAVLVEASRQPRTRGLHVPTEWAHEAQRS